MRGIPRKAVELNLPIEGTPYTARDIANTDPTVNCKWCTYCYAVNMKKPGAQEWYDGLIRHIAGLGADFIKYDDIVPYPEEVEAVTKAIAKTGKPIVLSLSPGDIVDANAIGSFKKANMLRVTHDIWDDPKGIDACFKAWRKWQGKESPGFWVDMDMIPFGQLQLMSQPCDAADGTEAVALALAGKGTHRQSLLTRPQMETFITMRALAASPLMVGGDLPTMDAFSLHLLTNREVLACNQNGVMGSLVYEAESLETWKVEQDTAGRGWIGVFNRTDQERIIEITSQLLGLKDGGYELKEIWSGGYLACGSKASMAPNGVLFIRYKRNKEQ